MAVSEEIAEIVIAAFVAGVKSEAKKQATAAGKRAVSEGIAESNLQIARVERKITKVQRAANKKLSEAFKMANNRYRLKDGTLRKGRTQADIAKLAQKLRKKM